ncbi:MAG: hypothetical protein JXA99_15290 [Candidatus Lokiarchaeota archaeon]|nr:hypothetical protein [Candidatus Lokiarchaeota archaeon]
MTKGTFCILIPLDSDYKILGYYFKNKDDADFKITSDLFLRLNLDHERSDYNFLKLKDHKIFSYIKKFEGKNKNKALGFILGLLLDEEEKPDKFRSPLKEASESLEDLNILKITEDEFSLKIKEIYQETLEPMIDILKPEALRDAVINRTKELLSGGKKERKLAQELLEKVENREYEKITQYYKNAKNELKSDDYEKAGKIFSKACEIALELLGEDSEITKSLKEKASYSQKTPELSKKRDKIVQDARIALKNEDFHQAYLLYKQASEISKELVQFEKEEEYRLKSKALNDFYQVDLKFKKE